MPNRENVIHAVKTAFDVWIDEYTGCSWFKEDEVRQAKEDALALLKERDNCENCAIAIEDRQPVVRCKDCKHSEPWYGDKSRCFLWHETGIDVFNDGFCNYGKRKEER